MFGSPFMTGLLGGFLGAGLAGMLFGGPAMAATGGSAGGMLGMLLQFAVLGGLAWLAVSFFRRMAGGGSPGPLARVGATSSGAQDTGFDAPRGSAGLPAFEPGPDITDDDRQAFGALLAETQTAWGKGDLAALQRLATPEMVSYFAEDLADAASRGERNVVTDVVLQKGDVVDHWVEGDRQYATAVMTWSALDYRERDGHVVDGDPRAPVEATEAWTFVRAAGGRWLLSAIQQV
jgi:predicted lipid-binding transport protein (Tim44 family)